MKSEGKTMKKILFASTALVATAGVAAADVTFGGYGRFGLRYAEQPAGSTASDTFLESRFRLNIDGTAETDGGVQFSARVRLQADDNGAANTAGTAGLNGARFTTQYEGFRVDVGNIAGVIDNLPNYYGFEPGLTAFNGQYTGVDYAFDAYSSGGAGVNGVFAQYAFGDFAVSASFSPEETGAGEQYGISAQYSGANWAVALGYSENDPIGAGADNSDMLVLTASATFGAFTGVIFVGDESSDLDPTGANFDTFYGLSVNYEVGAATDVIFSYGDGSATNDTQSIGLGVVQDLGGGVSLKGGIGQNNTAGVDQMVGDLGVQFNF
jgi:outer membrane protein OmpU